LLVDTAVDDIAPYRAYILEITDGNHETAVRKNHEIDLVERLWLNYSQFCAILL
jgi:hypothetical protein